MHFSKDFYVVANWKSVLGVDFISLAKDFLGSWPQFYQTKLILCPPYLYVREIFSIIQDSSIAIGVQDVSEFPGGAYTGEISAKYLSSIGIPYSIIGHAERRKYQKETNQIIKNKFKQLISESVVPIVCIGESDPDAEEEIILRFLENQLSESVSGSDNKFYIAYEPTYAIGGSQISFDKLRKINMHIKNYIIQLGYTVPIPVLYGGGVDSFKQLYSLWKEGTVDGVLLGRASLNPNKLVTMLTEVGFL